MCVCVCVRVCVCVCVYCVCVCVCECLNVCVYTVCLCAQHPNTLLFTHKHRMKTKLLSTPHTAAASDNVTSSVSYKITITCCKPRFNPTIETDPDVDVANTIESFMSRTSAGPLFSVVRMTGGWRSDFGKEFAFV